MTKTGAQILIQVLLKQKANVIFGYPGGNVLDIYDELYRSSDKIRHILSAHEQNAVHAADGYARISGKVGVVLSTSGPGATNLVTGIANAYLDSVPLMVITGNVPTYKLGKDSFQEVDIIGITAPVVKHNFIVKDINELEYTLLEAFVIADMGRKGPVLVDIPKNIQTDICEYRDMSIDRIRGKLYGNIHKNISGFRKNDMDSAVEMISRSKKTFIYCGGGVAASDSGAEIMRLSELIGAPVGLSMMGITSVPYSFKNNLGMCGMHGNFSASLAQSEADLIIAAGVRFSDRANVQAGEYSQKFDAIHCDAKHYDVIHIDIDDAEIGKNIKSEVGLCGDVKEILNQILAKLQKQDKKDWLDEILKHKKCEKVAETAEFTPYNIINILRRFTDDDTVIATDVGQHQMWTVKYYKFEKPRTLLSSGGLGTMGFGLGAAIGSCIAQNGKKTYLITGDGSFAMNLIELATAVSESLPVTVIIMNNNSLGMVRQWQDMFYDKRYSNSTLNKKTDFVMLAKSFGAEGYRAETCAKFQEIIESTLNLKTPCVIDCKISIDEKVLPMIPPEKSVSEIII